MTRRLYYENPYLVEFEAQILERRSVSSYIGLVLDQTCFYPTSGGQPSDRGTLTGVSVIDVFEDAEAIVHMLKEDVPGKTVVGHLDWARRFDHMQQHTGQHILSEAFQQLLGAATVSFHLGEEICTIDLDRDKLSAEDAARAEQLANEIVLADRPVVARFYEESELATLPLRKMPTKTENIRIVVVQGFDYSPCGGTHCRATGEVGPIKIRKWERRGQETRVEFLCGWRALRDYAWKHEAIAQLAHAFSVKDRDLVSVISHLAEDANAQRKELEYLRDRLLTSEAEELSAQSPNIAGVKVIMHVFTGRDPEEVRRLALRISGGSQRVALFAIAADKGRLVFARSADVPGDMNHLLKEVHREFGGGGGGQSHLAQGGGLEASRLQHALDFAATRLQGMIVGNQSGGSQK